MGDGPPRFGGHDEPRCHPASVERPPRTPPRHPGHRSEEHTSELQSLMRISYAVFCLKKKKNEKNKEKKSRSKNVHKTQMRKQKQHDEHQHNTGIKKAVNNNK